jgi:Zn-dependent alcohol dehydrogenase
VHEQSHLCLASGETRFVPRFARADGSEGFGFTGLGTFADQMTVNEGFHAMQQGEVIRSVISNRG